MSSTVPPPSPTKSELRPNPHPYAIKTTLTGLLSRSNSSPQNVHTARTHYLPPLTSPSRSGHRSHHGQGHKYSKSSSSDFPSPLPVPPLVPFPSAIGGTSGDENDATPRHRLKRADTLPSEASPCRIRVDSAMASEDLPSDPKSWTPSQLAVYLSTALRVKSGESLSPPQPVAHDIAQFLQKHGITGKVFLRFNDSHLEEMGVNQLWRSALLSASRNLRRNVLRGRIWGIASPADDDDDEPSTRTHSTHRHKSDISSGEDNASDAEGGWQPSASSIPGSAPIPAIYPFQRAGSYRNGRVKGMVETFERTRSGSASGSEGSEDGWTRNMSTNSVLGNAPPHTAHSFGGGAESEEPTVEALLSTNQESWGARAWEDVGIGQTVKRIVRDHGAPDVGIPDGGGTRPVGDLSVDGTDVFQVNGSSSDTESGGAVETGKSFGGSVKNGGLERQAHERRTVTAPSAGPERISQSESSPASSSSVAGGVAGDSYAGPPTQMLSDLEDIRSLVEAFQRRLEELERKVQEMEAREMVSQHQEQLRRNGEGQFSESSHERDETDQGHSITLSFLRPFTILSRIVGFLSRPSKQLSSPSANRPSIPTSPPTSSDRAGYKPLDANTGALYRALHPTTLSALPSYIILVGIGMCAMVLQVAIRRIIERRRGWHI